MLLPETSTLLAMLPSACVRSSRNLSLPNISMSTSRGPDSAEDLDFDSSSFIPAFTNYTTSLITHLLLGVGVAQSDMLDVVGTFQEDRVSHWKDAVDVGLDPIVGPNFFDSFFFNSQYVHAIVVLVEEVESLCLEGELFNVSFQLKTHFRHYLLVSDCIVFYYMQLIEEDVQDLSCLFGKKFSDAKVYTKKMSYRVRKVSRFKIYD